MKPTASLSIGDVSRLTGIPIDTLRTWERRYGFPKPMRRSSGHRRFAMAAVDRLRLVRRVLGTGRRASEVVPASTEELWSWLPAAPLDPGSSNGHEEPLEEVARWLAASDPERAAGLDARFRATWRTLGPRRFVDDLAAPFLRNVGKAFAQGDGATGHPHAATERLRAFLVEQRRDLELAADGPVVVCATPPGEVHDMGLLLASIVFSTEGLRVAYLGAEASLEDMLRAVEQSGARALVVGFSEATEEAAARQFLQALRPRVSSRVPVVVGGVRSPGVRGVTVIDTYERLASWARTLKARWAGPKRDLRAVPHPTSAAS